MEPLGRNHALGHLHLAHFHLPSSAFFGGMPMYRVIDNFPAAVMGSDPLHPRLTRGFLEYAQHRGFFADPARARHPKDKPKVERSAPYARERFFVTARWIG